MRNKRWLRYSLASLTLMGTGLGALVVACGDDDNAVDTRPDSGSADTGSPGYDSGSPNDGGDKPGIDAGVGAKIIMVHAATSLGASTDVGGFFAGGVRVCYATATTPNPTDSDFATAPLSALPSGKAGPAPYAGLFIGTGGLFPTSGLDLEGITIRPYLMNAKSLHERGIEGEDPSTPRCGKLLGDGGIDGGNLENNVDFWQLADVPAGTLKKNKTYVLAVTGCTSNAVGPGGPLPPGFCGKDDKGDVFTPDGTPGLGNLKILVLEVDTTGTVASDEFGVAAINLSPQQEAAKAFTGPFKPTLLNAEFLDGGGGADASTGVFAVVPGFGEVAFDRTAKSATAVAKIKGLATPHGYFALANGSPPSPDVPVGAAKLNNVNAANPATTVQTATTGDPSTTELYVNGTTYTFVLVGDPMVPPSEGPRTLHYLGFSNAQ